MSSRGVVGGVTGERPWRTETILQGRYSRQDPCARKRSTGCSHERSDPAPGVWKTVGVRVLPPVQRRSDMAVSTSSVLRGLPEIPVADDGWRVRFAALDSCRQEDPGCWL